MKAKFKKYVHHSLKLVNSAICAILVASLAAIPIYIPIALHVRYKATDFKILFLATLMTFFAYFVSNKKIHTSWKMAITLCAICAFITPVCIFISTTLVAYIIGFGWLKLSLMATTGILGAKALNSAFISLGMVFLSIKLAIK